MARLLGVVASVAGWLGWLTLTPAVGVPSLATAAMLNRVLSPREDPGFWLGWALLLLALLVAALVYLVAVDRGRLRPGVLSGTAYGALCWLFVGALVMPLLGLAVPPAASGAPPALTPPDPMRGSFMMLHLGIGAPIAALVAWLLFGAVLGGTAGSRSTNPSVHKRVPSWSGGPTEPLAVNAVVVAAALALLAIFAGGWVVGRLGAAWPASPATATKPYSGPVRALPQGTAFVSIIELPQAAGSVLGPHAHVPGFAWSLDGVETINFHDGISLRIGPGEAGFMAAQAVHSHVNADDRLPAAAVALVILALAVLTGLLALRSSPAEGRWLWVALVGVVVAGLIGIWNPWSNDWLFVSIRPVAARGAAMPLPSASRVYESANLAALPAGPYVETVEELRVPSSGQATDVGSAGAVVLLVLDGGIDVRPASGRSSVLGVRGATLVQPGTQVVVSNRGDRPARVLKFAVTPTSASS
jgi:hypothetical protein